MAEAGLGNFAGDVPRTCRTLLTDVGSGLMYKVCSTSGCPHLVSSGSLCDECRKAKDKRRTRGRNPYTSKAHRLARARVLARDPRCVCPGDGPDGCGRHHGLCGAPEHHEPTIGRSNASSSSKQAWTPTTRNACAACASAATTARPQGRNLRASTTDKTSADTHRLRHQNKTFHRSQADDASRSRRTTRKTKTTKSFRFDSRLIAAANESNKKRCKTNGSKPSKHPRGYPLTVWVTEPPESCLRGAEGSKVSEGAGERPGRPDSEGTARGRPTMEEPCQEEENASGPARCRIRRAVPANAGDTPCAACRTPNTRAGRRSSRLPPYVLR